VALTPDPLFDLLTGSEMPRRSYQEIADDFEKQMKNLLKKSGFENVNGGRNFYFGRNQIDACGGFENTLFIVECKTSQKLFARLRDEIRKFRGQIYSIKSAASRHEVYKRYQKIIFIIATNFEVHERDRTGAGRVIKIWDKAFTSHYDQLVSKIGTYTKFSILGEVNLAPEHGGKECLPCIKHRVRSVNLFLFVASPKMILRWAYVARREVGSEHYYQRFVESGKLNRIAEYIRDEAGYFPNAAVLAFNKKPTFVKARVANQNRFPNWARGNVEFGFLYFPASFRSCLIIDGQHRLFGAGKVKSPTIMMPMVALERSTIENQAGLFLTINKNQKPVPSDLVWDLEGEMRPDSPEGAISRIAKNLNRRAALAGKIYIPQGGRKRKKQLKLSGICTAISNQKLTDRVLKNKRENPLHSEYPDRLIKSVTKSILLALAEVDKVFERNQKSEFWYQNSGIAILLALVGRIVANCGHSPTNQEYRRYFKALKNHLSQYRSHEKVKALRQRCNSEGGRQDVVAEFGRAISTELGDTAFGEGLPEDKFEQRIKRVERGLAEMVSKILSRNDPNWFAHRVSGDIGKRVTDRRQKQNAGGEPIENFLTFGESVAVVRQANNWDEMKSSFIVRGGFDNPNQLETASQTINELRARTMHGRGKFSVTDETFLDGCLGKFEFVLNK
jgi:DGQHR domain-containing protein